MDNSLGTWYPSSGPICMEPVEILSSRGYRMRSWRKKMPLFTPEILGCVFYLYPTRVDAETEVGEKAGGTGFFIGVSPEIPNGRVHVYGVTCKHVVKASRNGLASPVVRLNTRGGGFDVIELTPDHWVSYEDAFPGQRHDIAVHEFGPVEQYDILFPNQSQILTREKEKLGELTPAIGDEVVMIGRYLDHPGSKRNIPSVRFGNISIMNWEPLEHQGYKEESFVVEMRSLSGFSGSPVFIMREFHQIRYGRVEHEHNMFLLGMQWSHQPHYEYNEDEGKIVKVYSGLGNVLPAWYLDDLLNWETFKMHRKKRDAEFAQKPKKSQVLTGASPTAKPFTRADFEEALKKASKPRPDEGKGGD